MVGRRFGRVRGIYNTAPERSSFCSSLIMAHLASSGSINEDFQISDECGTRCLILEANLTQSDLLQATVCTNSRLVNVPGIKVLSWLNSDCP